MSDNAQTIVDVEAKARDAKKLASRVCDHLRGLEVIGPKKKGCVLGADAGYSPGKRFADACEGKANPGFTKLLTNGMEVVAHRTVFEAGGNGLEVVCPKCKKKIIDGDDAWFEAAGAWFEGDEAAAYACPKCRKPSPLNDWDGPWPWAFGNLGFKF